VVGRVVNAQAMCVCGCVCVCLLYVCVSFVRVCVFCMCVCLLYVCVSFVCVCVLCMCVCLLYMPVSFVGVSLLCVSFVCVSFVCVSVVRVSVICVTFGTDRRLVKVIDGMGVFCFLYVCLLYMYVLAQASQSEQLSSSICDRQLRFCFYGEMEVGGGMHVLTTIHAHMHIHTCTHM